MMRKVCNMLYGCLLLLWVMAASGQVYGQKLINYQAGMGSRDASDPDVWILYDGVRADHDGMVLYADSALLNTKVNDFRAFGHVKIEVSDTTTIWGDRLYYDGMSRVAEIWDDTVLLIDGGTVLVSPKMTYDRYACTATYEEWGVGYNEGRTLVSDYGRYNTETDVFFVRGGVVLADSTSRLLTDTLYYNTQSKEATMVCPTRIYSDTNYIYTERGSYNSGTGMAVSEKASHLVSGPRSLDCDLLHYNEKNRFGQAWGNVVLVDSVNNIVCTGGYGQTDQAIGMSLVTDSALVRVVDRGDTVWVHADTLRMVNDSSNHLREMYAYWHVKMFRKDGQGKCDSAYYTAQDSVLSMYGSPVLWSEQYQCTADTISMKHDSAGVTRAWFRSSTFMTEQVDRTKFNQLKGKQGVAYFEGGEPVYFDILGNAQMVYYVTDEDAAGRKMLVGVNAGMGSDMRIYIKDRQPTRVATYINPDMHTYPLKLLPKEYELLPGFSWQEESRPKSPMEVLKW